MCFTASIPNSPSDWLIDHMVTLTSYSVYSMLNALLAIPSTFVSAGPVHAGPRRGYPQASATDYTGGPQAGNSIARREDLFGHCPYVNALPHQIFRCLSPCLHL